MKPTLTLFAALLLAAPPSAQVLVKDINEAPSTVNPDSLADEFFTVGSWTYFKAEDDHGVELWKSDGTEAGTSLLMDIWPGGESSEPSDFVEYQGLLYFTAYHPLFGREIWRTDGTVSGTEIALDAVPGAGSSGPSGMTEFGGELYFSALGSNNESYELHAFDGVNPFRLVAEIYPGLGGSYPHDFTHFDGRLAFVAENADRGEELWITDGTPAGTLALTDIAPGPDDSSPNELTVYNGELYFTARVGVNVWELHKNDGTPGGTTQLTSFGISALPTSFYLTVFGGWLWFSGNDGQTELWRTDGTVLGTQQFIDLNGATSSSPRYLFATDTLMYFGASESATGREVWRTDGTLAGTFLVEDVKPGPGGQVISTWGHLGGDTVLFKSSDGVTGGQPWVTSGTSATTSMVAVINPEGSAAMSDFFVGVDGKVWFHADDSVTGKEFWSSDGTGAGTGLVRDIHPAGSVGSDPNDFVVARERLFFNAYDGVNGRELWVSDGTEVGTYLLKDIAPGAAGSWTNDFYNWNETVYFSADDGTHGDELWVSDGTEEGTYMLADIHDTFGSNPYGFTEFAGELYFAASSADTGFELFKTDGTPGGTVLVADIQAGGGNSSPSWFAVLGEHLYFLAYRSDVGQELFRTDGTELGTELVADIEPGILSSTPVGMTAFEDILLFAATRSDVGRELFKSDGTAAGTVLLKDLKGGDDGWPHSFSVLGDVVVFQAESGFFSSRDDVWRTDGTTAGTTNLIDGVIMQAENLTLADDRVFFWNDSVGLAPGELWVTDGFFMSRVEDLDPNDLYSPFDSFELTAMGSGRDVILQYNDGLSGREIYVSDGTLAGTYMLPETIAGGLDGRPRNFTRAGDKVFFTAHDGGFGYELYALDFSQTNGFVAEPFGRGCSNFASLPEISATGEARPGSVLNVHLSGASPLTGAILFYSPDQVVVDVGFDCTLYFGGPFFWLPAIGVDGSGEGSQSLPIPVDPALVGASVAMQFLVGEAGGPFLGAVALTDGLEVIVGP